MKSRSTRFLLFAIIFSTAIFSLPSCKSCNKKTPAETDSSDSSGAASAFPMSNLPHADTTFIPILSAVLDKAFEASLKKDYTALGSFIVYRGPDSLRYGYDTFKAKNTFDKKIVKITSDVFNKWNSNLESREYGRVFEISQADGSIIPVMEVIFWSEKSSERKFFFFQQSNQEWKIAEITSVLR